MDHSEFPYGVEEMPGLLTPLGVLGWLLALALLVALLAQNRGPRKRPGTLDAIHATVLAAARFALKQDEFGVLRGVDILRRVIRTHLGGVLLAGASLNKQMKALGAAVGESDDKKDKKKDGHGGDAHGGDHGHGTAAAHHGHTTSATDTPGAVANTVQGHSITVNVAGEAGAHGEAGHGPDEKPPTLEEQLALARKAVREFEAWWSDKPARMAELRAAHDDLTTAWKPDPALMAMIDDKPGLPRSH
ncbi:MAG: hypothetical protein Q8L66_14595 [Caulobacter sp.]|nr:hypothetical protein [Caulobacter sp.]